MAFWLHLAAGKHPDRVALASAERLLTYSELAAMAVNGAAALQAAGVDGGDRVALEIEDRLDFAIALHACLLNGSPAMPIDLRLSAPERAARAEGAATVLTAGGLDAPGERARGAHVAGPDMLDLVATVMHTSGTTAAPKRVELTYGNWLANALGSAVAVGLDPQERWLCAMPLAHVGGLSILIRSAIYATTVVLHERFETEAVLEALMDPAQRITIVSLVPTMLSRLLDAGLREPPALRWALLGGGPIAPALLARAAQARVPVAPTYGMTEACSQIATFGHPLHGVEFRLDGPGREIWVRGPVVAPGALAEDGWLHTGDLGELADGELRIVGRKADTIVSGGENVAPAEVEAVLLEHPAVADAGVTSRADPEWGEALIALLVPRPGAALDAGELRRFCAERLAPFKVPKAFEQTQELPRTPSGKLLRRELRALVP
jgi:O-succinylbenzoic acid--CoA ligase